MARARKRVLGSIFGLLILLSSYLLLQTLNPELLVLKINKIPVATGVLFLDDEAYRVLTSPANTEEIAIQKDILNPTDEEARMRRIQELLDNPAGRPRAAYVSWNMSDLRDQFGELELGKHKVGSMKGFDPRWEYSPPDTGPWQGIYNFQNFKLKGLFFLPGTNVKLITYFLPDYNRINKKDEILRATSMKEINEIMDIDRRTNEYIYPNCSALKGGPCALAMLEGKGENGNYSFDQKSVPLSLRIEYWGRGVYLHSDKFGQVLPVLNYSSSIPYLSNYNFNDITTKIELKNWLEGEDGKYEKTINYLAILHEDEHFRGQLRIFFEEFPDPSVGKYGNLPTNSPDGPVPANKAVLDFNTDGKIDEYGKVEKPSAVQVFQMPQTASERNEWLRKGCEVRLCAKRAEGTLKDLFQDCLIYNFSHLGTGISKTGETVPMFKPFSIPDKEIQAYNGDGSKAKDENNNDKKTNFRNNINSLQIEGNCLVVLFENAVGDEMECMNNPEKCWEKGTPGDNPEVFSPNDPEYPNYMDLTPANVDANRPRHEIGYCRSGTWPKRAYQSCASAIAIYPVK